MDWQKREAFEAAPESATVDASKVNPVWTAIVNKLRAGSKEAFEEHTETLGETIP